MPAAEARDPARRLPYEERQAQLMDVAERLFVENGYAAVTMEDIARAAGVTRPIVYRHFDTREGAYLACVRRARENYVQRLALRVEEMAAAPSRAQLAAGGEVFFAMLEEDRGKWRLLFGGNAVLPGEYTRELAELRFGTIALIRSQLRAAAADSVPDLLVEAGANAISGAGERLGHWWLTRPDLRREHVVELFVQIVWAGISPFVRDT